MAETASCVRIGEPDVTMNIEVQSTSTPPPLSSSSREAPSPSPRKGKRSNQHKRVLCRYGIGCTHIHDVYHQEKFYHPPRHNLTIDELRTHYICNECGSAYLSLTDLQYHLTLKTAWTNESLVNARVSCLLDHKEWHEGYVLQFHRSGRHYVEFRTTGERRWLEMLKIAFYIVERDALTKKREKDKLQQAVTAMQGDPASGVVGDSADSDVVEASTNSSSGREFKDSSVDSNNSTPRPGEDWTYTEDISPHYAFAQSVLFKIYGSNVQETGHKTKGHVSLTSRDRDLAKNARGSLLYGELLPRGANKALGNRRLRAETASVLFDLGMGTGKVAIQAFLQFNNLEYVYGVEMSQGRFNLAAEAAHTMVLLLGESNFDVHEIRGRSITVTERPQPGEDPNDIRVLHMEQGNLLDVDNINIADIIMLETDVPTDYLNELCFLLKDLREGARTLSYLDLRKIWSLPTFSFRQLEINKYLSDRYPTSWSVQRGHHFFLFQQMKEYKRSSRSTRAKKQVEEEHREDEPRSSTLWSSNHKMRVVSPIMPNSALRRSAKRSQKKPSFFSCIMSIFGCSSDNKRSGFVEEVELLPQIKRTSEEGQSRGKAAALLASTSTEGRTRVKSGDSDESGDDGGTGTGASDDDSDDDDGREEEEEEEEEEEGGGGDEDGGIEMSQLAGGRKTSIPSTAAADGVDSEESTPRKDQDQDQGLVLPDHKPVPRPTSSSSSKSKSKVKGKSKAKAIKDREQQLEEQEEDSGTVLSPNPNISSQSKGIGSSSSSSSLTGTADANANAGVDTIDKPSTAPLSGGIAIDTGLSGGDGDEDGVAFMDATAALAFEVPLSPGVLQHFDSNLEPTSMSTPQFLRQSTGEREGNPPSGPTLSFPLVQGRDVAAVEIVPETESEIRTESGGDGSGGSDGDLGNDDATAPPVFYIGLTAPAVTRGESAEEDDLQFVEALQQRLVGLKIEHDDGDSDNDGEGEGEGN